MSNVDTPEEPDDREYDTHFVYCKIPEKLDPFARADLYEDPLTEVLETEGLGEVTGGGTAIGEGGVTHYVGIDIELNDLVGALERTAEVLEALGVPRGTKLQYREEGESKERFIGTWEPVIIYVDGEEMHKAEDWTTHADALTEQMTTILEETGAGQFRTAWGEGEETALYFGTPSSERLLAVLEPVLAASPLCRNPRVVRA